MMFFGNPKELGETVDRSDVLVILDVLAKVQAPLQTLCGSPRKSEQNDKALAMLKEAEDRISDVINPELTAENTDDAEIESSAPTRSM